MYTYSRDLFTSSNCYVCNKAVNNAVTERQSNVANDAKQH